MHRDAAGHLTALGLSRERGQIDEWMKDLAPSDRLRKWFRHDFKRCAGTFRWRHLEEGHDVWRVEIAKT